MKGRFDDVKKNHGDVILIKGMRILNTNMWPRDRDSSQRCGHKTLYVDAERFRPVKRNEEWIVVASHMNEMYLSLSGETTVVTCPTMKFCNCMIFNKYSHKYQNLLHIIQILLVIQSAMQRWNGASAPCED